MTIRLEQSIEVSAPVEDAYNVWSQFSNFPDFMGNTHDTEITEQEEKKFIYWQTLKGVRSTATVRFTPLTMPAPPSTCTTPTGWARRPRFRM